MRALRRRCMRKPYLFTLSNQHGGPTDNTIVDNPRYILTHSDTHLGAAETKLENGRRVSHDVAEPRRVCGHERRIVHKTQQRRLYELFEER